MFEFFTLLTDQEAKRMAREEARAKPKPEEPKGIDIQFKPGIYRYRTKKERRPHVNAHSV
jgi:hypothetical protein